MEERYKLGSVISDRKIPSVIFLDGDFALDSFEKYLSKVYGLESETSPVFLAAISPAEMRDKVLWLADKLSIEYERAVKLIFVYPHPVFDNFAYLRAFAGPAPSKENEIDIYSVPALKEELYEDYQRFFGITQTEAESLFTSRSRSQ